MSTQAAEPVGRPPAGSGGWLVGSALLVVDPTPAQTTTDVVTACLLIAQQQADLHAPDARGTVEWSGQLTSSLTALGWELSSNQTSGSSPAGSGLFDPWTLIEESLTLDLDANRLQTLTAWAGVLAADPRLTERWRSASQAPADQPPHGLVGTATSGEAGAQLVLSSTRLGYNVAVTARQRPLFPWGHWPAAGATLTQSTAALVLDASDIQPLLAALGPKVAPVLHDEVIPLAAA